MPPEADVMVEERDLVLVDKGPLAGTFCFPRGEQAFPAVLLIAGSGAVNRDGNGPGTENNCLKLLAHGLAHRGIASVRFDKRGVGRSAAACRDESDLRFQTYVDDAAHWLTRLRREPRVSRAYLLGHSEGALIATMVAQTNQVSGVVLVAGVGQRIDDVLRRQLREAGLPGSLLTEADRILSSLADGKPALNVPQELLGLFRPSVQPYFTSWLALDPAEELAKVACRTLVVQGTADLQVTTTDSDLLGRAGPHVRIRLIPAMNHVLKLVQDGRAANLAAYREPDQALAPALISAVADFLNGDRL